MNKEVLSDEKIKKYSENPPLSITGCISDGRYYAASLAHYTGFTSPKLVTSAGVGLDYSKNSNSLSREYWNESDSKQPEEFLNTFKKYFKEDLKFFCPANAYLRYIQSADLSKEELQNILNKINSSSEKAQAGLCEVVKAIESKLANM